MRRSVIVFGCLLALGLPGTSGLGAEVETGRVEITVVDRATGKLTPCAVRWKSACVLPSSRAPARLAR